MTRAQDLESATYRLTAVMNEYETTAETIERIMDYVASEPASAQQEQVWRDLYPLTEEEIAEMADRAERLVLAWIPVGIVPMERHFR